MIPTLLPTSSAFWKTLLNHNTSLQSLSRVRLFAIPWSAVHQTSLFITKSWSILKLICIESVIPSNHLIPCCPLLLLPSIFSGMLQSMGSQRIRRDWATKLNWFFFKFFSHFKLLQNIEQFPMLYIGSCWLSILNIAVCTCQSQTCEDLFAVLKELICTPVCILSYVWLWPDGL